MCYCSTIRTQMQLTGMRTRIDGLGTLIDALSALSALPCADLSALPCADRVAIVRVASVPQPPRHNSLRQHIGSCGSRLCQHSLG